MNTSTPMPRDIDRILDAWFEEGPTLPADRVVGAALAETEQVAQVRPLRRMIFGPSDGRSSRIALMAAAAALIVLAIGFAIQAGIIRLPTPSPPVVPSASAAPSAQTVGLSDGPATEDGYAFVFPESWEQTEAEGWQYEGTDPIGRLSVMMGTGGDIYFCPDACTSLVFDMPVPFSPERAVDLLSAAISGVTGNEQWEPLPPGSVPDLEAGRRQVNTVVDEEWGESQQVVVIGDYVSRVFALTFTQPVGTFDEDLLSDLMAGVFLDPAGPTYAQGVPMPVDELSLGWTIEVPDNWCCAYQPTMTDGTSASGVRQFNWDHLLVSVGDLDGDLRLCQETCREYRSLSSADALRNAIAGWLPPAAAGTTDETGPVSVSGIEGSFLLRQVEGQDGQHTRYVVYAVEGGRPFVLAFDAPSELVTRGAIEQIVSTFRFTGSSASSETAFVAPDGSFEIRLDRNAWRTVEGADAETLYLRRGRTFVLVRMGDDRGEVRPCDEPAPGDWEQCKPVRAASLDQLAARAAIPEDPRYAGNRTVDSTLLGGEPAVVGLLETYEPEARGGQWLAYVLAMHERRPIVIRLWSGSDQEHLQGMDEILAGFRFTD